MPRVLLFDIDNTLLYSGGAGSVAMAQAFEQYFWPSEESKTQSSPAPPHWLSPEQGWQKLLLGRQARTDESQYKVAPQSSSLVHPATSVTHSPV